MKSCQRCGFKNEDNARFCESCGEEFAKSSNNLICRQCGKPVLPGAKFCTNCGSVIKDIEEPAFHDEDKWEYVPPEKPKKSNQKKMIPIVCIIVAIAIVSIIVILVDKARSDNAEVSDDSNVAASVDEPVVGEAVMNKEWYHTIEKENDAGNEHYTFVFRDDGILDFEYWQEATSVAANGDLVEYSFVETEKENVWILNYSGDFTYWDDDGITNDSSFGRIECEYAENLGIITMVPLSGRILYDYSRSEPFVIATKASNQLAIEYEKSSKPQEPSLTQSEASSIANEIVPKYLYSYISDFNDGRYSALADVVEAGSDFELDKINWINKCNFYEEIINYDIESVSVINNGCIHATSIETYYVYGKLNEGDYYITQKATYVIRKQSGGNWKISAYDGGVKDVNKEYV